MTPEAFERAQQPTVLSRIASKQLLARNSVGTTCSSACLSLPAPFWLSFAFEMLYKTLKIVLAFGSACVRIEKAVKASMVDCFRVVICVGLCRDALQ